MDRETGASALIAPGQSVVQPYTGPAGGHVMLSVSSDEPIRGAILDSEMVELVFAGPHRRLAFGTVVRPTVRWYVQIDNPGVNVADVSWSVKELLR